jgi:hypothetical protein
MRGLFFRKMGALRPADEAGEAILSKCREDELVAVDVKRGRNLRHFRKFWKLMQIVYENQAFYSTPEQICTVFKIRTGHCDWIVTKEGDYKIPRSISFAKMDQTEFSLFYDKAVDFLCTEVIPGMDSAALKREVEELLN